MTEELESMRCDGPSGCGRRTEVEGTEYFAGSCPVRGATFSTVCTIQYQSSSQQRQDVCFRPGWGWSTSLSPIAEEGLASSGADHAKRAEGNRHGGGKGGSIRYWYSVLRIDDIRTPMTKYSHSQSLAGTRPGGRSGSSTRYTTVTSTVHVPSTSGIV